jgi:starch phosphorylase
MSKQIRVSHPIYNLLPAEIEGFDSLAEFDLDMCWSWNHATDEVWRQLDPELWEIMHNPWVVLQTVSRKVWGFETFFIRITNPPAQNRLR